MEKHRISSDFSCKSYYCGTLQELPQPTLGEAQRPTVREGKFNWQVPCDNMCKREPRCWQSVMHDQPNLVLWKIQFINVVFNQQAGNICAPAACVATAQRPCVSIFPCISSETPSLPPVSFPPIQFSPLVFWKGGYIPLLLYDFTEPPLPAFEAVKNGPKLSDPCCKPPVCVRPESVPLPGLFPLPRPRLHSSCFFIRLEQIYVGSTDFSGHFLEGRWPRWSWPEGICPGGGLWK